MGNRTRNCLVLFAKSDSFVIIPEKSKTKKNPVILRLTRNLSVLEKLNFASLFPEIQDLPTVRLSCFLDQFISTLSAGNYSVKFQDLEISTENSPCELF